MGDPKCKICRRAGQKLFLKGERCFSPKCAMIRRPYPPGLHGQKRRRAASSFGQQLAEKQKVRSSYHLSEQQFSRYIKEAIRRSKAAALGGVALGDFIARSLELRLDNAVFRSGFAFSRSVARHLVSHGHFLVNGRRVDVPSYALRKGDMIAVRPESLKLALFVNLAHQLKAASPPAWLEVDEKASACKILEDPSVETAALSGELSMVIEHYSR